MEPTFFPTPSDFRRWLTDHHEVETELIVGYYKKGSGQPSMTWSESVDQALCFGWIDGVRRGLDETRYQIRFTPRKPRSIWSAVNIEKVAELTRQGLMHPAGLKAFEARSEARSAVYSFEQKEPIGLAPEDEAELRANAQAWEFFQAQPPGYRKQAIWHVLGAKREETRRKRLAQLVADCAEGRKLAHLTRPGEKKKARE